MNIQKVLKTLREEGCPEDVIRQVVEYYTRDPETSVCDLNRHLDKIATQFGHQNYRAFKGVGFRSVPQDDLLVSAIYSPV